MRRHCFPRKSWTSWCCSSKLLPLYTDVNLILLLGVSLLLLVVMGGVLVGDVAGVGVVIGVADFVDFACVAVIGSV